MANSNLTNARNAKNDEFYTQYHDIEKEVAAYLEYDPKVLHGKTVLLPCDDPEWSNFTFQSLLLFLYFLNLWLDFYHFLLCRTAKCN